MVDKDPDIFRRDAEDISCSLSPVPLQSRASIRDSDSSFHAGSILIPERSPDTKQLHFQRLRVTMLYVTRRISALMHDTLRFTLPALAYFVCVCT